MLIMRTPSETAHLLPMAPKSAYVTVWGTDVPHQDALVFATTRQDVLVQRPGERTDAMGVPLHRPNHLTLLDVPDLHFAIVGAN